MNIDNADQDQIATESGSTMFADRKNSSTDRNKSTLNRSYKWPPYFFFAPVQKVKVALTKF